MDHDELKTELLATDNVFKSLQEEHDQCELRLEEIISKEHVTADEDVVAKQIKLHKLHLKDRMEQILRSHLTPAAS